MKGPLLQTDQLTKNYGRLCALDRLSLTVQPGEIVGLLGPNGSGKSTTLRLILGFLKPTSGHASVAGHDCWRESVQARRQVAYLPGELRLYENMTGRQLVRFLSQLRQQSVRDDLDAQAQRLDLDLDRPIAHLSSGMKRKVALLQVLLPRVPLLILDEPTNTLDPVMRDELLAQLQQARQRGQAILFSSHVLTEVEQICNRVAILRAGKLVHREEMGQLKQGRRVKVHFAGRAPALPQLAGVAPAASLGRAESDWLVFNYHGELPLLLGWLAEHPVVDVHIEPLGLAEIYHFYHGNAA